MGNTERSQQIRWDIQPSLGQDVIAHLLESRGITDRERFFSPDYERDSHDPMLLPDIALALARIQKAIQEKESICVYGDYDADGIPGTAILVKTLQVNGALVSSYIPDREREGYGLNESAVKLLHERQVRLIITVDLGITGKAEVAFAKTLGIDVIITDHHHVDPERVPTDAIAIVHPAMPSSTYPFSGLAGGGVSWKLSQAIGQVTGKPNAAQLKWWLELPAISTVCDMVPLTDENRMIVHYGLKVLMQTRNVGLRALYRAGGIASDEITERTIGYQIGPRINAPGRIESASLALELLLADKEQLAQEYAAKIETQNRERQEQLDAVMKHAFQLVEEQKQHEKSAIVLMQEGWPTGVVGLAASRLIERYHRPTILLASHGGVAKGSGRSIHGFNLLAGVAECQDILLTYGGHEKAAGLQLKTENFPQFQKRFVGYAKANLTEESLVPRKTADMLLDPATISEELVTDLLRFAPFGVGNPKPRFVIAPLTVSDCRPVGATKQHLKLRFTTGLDAIAFNCGSLASICAVGQQIGILASLEFNSWNGHQTVQALVDDIKPVRQLIKEGVLSSE